MGGGQDAASPVCLRPATRPPLAGGGRSHRLPRPRKTKSPKSNGFPPEGTKTAAKAGVFFSQKKALFPTSLIQGFNRPVWRSNALVTQLLDRRAVVPRSLRWGSVRFWWCRDRGYVLRGPRAQPAMGK